MVSIQVNKFFLEEKITTFPVDPFQIINSNKWGLITYSELAKEKGVWIEDIIDAFQSEDGYTIYDGSNYTIAYNDTIYSKGRIRFTLMHEIGHIYLKHLLDFEETVLTRSTLTENKYKTLENEANSFARNLLAPVMVVKDLDLKTNYDLVDFFGLSQSAAKVRLKSLLQDYLNLSGAFIRFQKDYFRSFIYSVLHSKFCFICDHHFIAEEAEYCSICGSSYLINKKGMGKVIYNGHFLDDNSRATICPNCDNEHLNYEGDYCIICGTGIVNKCASTYRTYETGFHNLEPSCETLLDGDARFCMKCGNESTFFQQGLLEDWKKEKEREKSVNLKKLLLEEPLPF